MKERFVRKKNTMPLGLNVFGTLIKHYIKAAFRNITQLH